VKSTPGDSTTTGLLSQCEQIALADIRSWVGAPYTWKQDLMRKLEARGLVCAVGMRGDRTMWELTKAGKEHPL
jgi:hypothetical protein